MRYHLEGHVFSILTEMGSLCPEEISRAGALIENPEDMCTEDIIDVLSDGGQRAHALYVLKLSAAEEKRYSEAFMRDFDAQEEVHNLIADTELLKDMVHLEFRTRFGSMGSTHSLMLCKHFTICARLFPQEKIFEYSGMSVQ